LRRRAMYKALRDATITAALREQFRIVHISLQRTHVHLLVEADHKTALARGMQGFTIESLVWWREMYIATARGVATDLWRRSDLMSLGLRP
jgi:REP element-mobilizing transposase RayT